MNDKLGTIVPKVVVLGYFIKVVTMVAEVQLFGMYIKFFMNKTKFRDIVNYINWWQKDLWKGGGKRTVLNDNQKRNGRPMRKEHKPFEWKELHRLFKPQGILS